MSEPARVPSTGARAQIQTTMGLPTKWVAFAKRQLFNTHEQTVDAELRQRMRRLIARLERIEQECREISQQQNVQQHEQRIENGTNH